MSLHAVATRGGGAGLPWIVWLHGFLGSQRDWAPFAGDFSPWSQLRVDLPGHGGSAAISVINFAGVDRLLRQTLRAYSINHYWLVGYSLGGRVAMYHACKAHTPGLQGLIVEGSHPGLSAQNRRIRFRQDKLWAHKFQTQALEKVLGIWYQQPLFEPLSQPQKAQLIAERCHNHPAALADMLLTTSLGRQPDLHRRLSRLSQPFYYLCGEQDAKFRAVAKNIPLPAQLIPAAGHHAHRDNPAAFSSCLQRLLRSSNKEIYDSHR